MAQKVLVCDKVANEGVQILARAADVDMLDEPLPEQALCEKVAPYHALVVRSATKVTEPVIAAAAELRVIGRAGVGVDNIDVAAATERGIIVLNSPGGNAVAAAEHAIALMMALARNIAQANQSMAAGEWRKSDFMGTEVYQKTLGIIGVGRIGALVAERARGLGMLVLGCDPLLTSDRAARLGVDKVELDELLQRADFVTVHAAKTPETIKLISDRELGLMKASARLVNCARGGIVDEAALCRALQNGTIAGAALDVFETEPPGDTPLFACDNLIATPHLGASTAEAQVNVAVDVAEQIVEVLGGGPPRTSVNMPPIAPEVLRSLRPYMGLAEQMGKMHAELQPAAIIRVEMTYGGQLAEQATGPLSPAFLAGLLSPTLDQPVNLVNARLIARNRGIEIQERKVTGARDYGSLIVTEVTSQQQTTTAAGTVFGRAEPHIVELDGYRIDIVPEGLTIFIRHQDRPGLVGKVGTLLGDNEINIAGMQVGRERMGGEAVMALSVDQCVTPELLARIEEIDGISSSVLVDFSRANTS